MHDSGRVQEKAKMSIILQTNRRNAKKDVEYSTDGYLSLIGKVTWREEHMFEIVRKERLNDTVVRMDIKAPAIAHKAQPGQFIIFRTFEDSERIPLTIAGPIGEKAPYQSFIRS